MSIVNLKEDPGLERLVEDNNLLWLITDYTAGDYDGSGTAIGFDGKSLFSWNLGHCSCYGPADDPADVLPLRDYFGDSVAYWNSNASVELGHAVDEKLKAVDLDRIAPKSDAAICLLAQVRAGDRGLLPILADAIEQDGEHDADLLAWMRA